jgi:PAS domain S-box-containing protein
VNEPTAQIAGIPREALMGHATPDFFQNPDDRQIYVSRIQQEGSVNNYEVLLKKGDGSQFWALMSGKIAQFQGDTVTITSFIDITERQEAIAAVQANEYRYQQILDSLTQMVLVKGNESRIVWANKTFREFYGMSNEALQEMIDAPFNEPDYTQQYIKDDAYVFETGQVLDIPEEIVTRHDGHHGLFHTVKSPIFNEDDEVIMTVGISEEISERKKTEAMIAKQATELQTVAELSTQVSLIEDPQEMLELVVQETQKRFDLYHCHVFLMDDAGKHLRIRACGWHAESPLYGTHGDTRLPMNSPKSLVVQAALSQQSVIVNDVLNDPNWLPNELLPDTRSEMAVPLIVGNTVLGVLDVQSSEVDHFTDTDIKIQSTLAAQIAIALERARSAARTQAAIAELNAVTRQLTRESWDEYLTDEAHTETGYMYDLGELTPMTKAPMTQADGETAVSLTNGHLSHSLMVRGESIGQLTIFNETETNEIDEDAALIVAAIAEQLSARVENIRLTDQTQHALAQTQNQAQRLEMLNEISAAMSDVPTLDQVFEVVFMRISDLLNTDRVSLAMLRPDGESVEILRYQGEVDDAPLGTIMPLAGSPLGQAIQENRIIMSDSSNAGRVIKSSMIAPIASAGRAIGALVIGSKQVSAFTDRDENLLQQLATMLSSVVENKQLLAAAQARAERERQVRTITDRIRRGVDREAILTIAQKEISQLIGAKQSAAQLGTKKQLLERIQHQTQQGSD